MDLNEILVFTPVVAGSFIAASNVAAGVRGSRNQEHTARTVVRSHTCAGSLCKFLGIPCTFANAIEGECRP
jgi:hypothetical protein